MVVQPTALARRTRSSKNWEEASKRVIAAYREWYRAAPEILNLYQIDGYVTVPDARAKVREQFERNRFVQHLNVVDVLLAKSDMEYQEMMNYWKQLPHVMKYFRAQHDDKAQVPNTFMAGFLEGRN